VDRFGHGSDGSGQLREIAVAVARLDGLHRGSQGGLILNWLSHQVELRAKAAYLGSGCAFAGEDRHGCVFGVGKAGSGSHAEGVVDYQQD
jgi:hypothetical protein